MFKKLMLLCAVWSISACIVVPEVFAQVATNICGPNSGISWNMNTEADMATYVVYHSTMTPIVPNAPEVFAFEVPHDPSTAVPDDIDPTKLIVSTNFPDTFPDGLRFFAVSAKDLVGNESGVSNEVSCLIDGSSPISPTIFLRFK